MTHKNQFISLDVIPGELLYQKFVIKKHELDVSAVPENSFIF